MSHAVYSEADIADTLEAIAGIGETIPREVVESWGWDQRRDVRVWCWLERRRREADATVPEMPRPAWLPAKDGAA